MTEHRFQQFYQQEVNGYKQRIFKEEAAHRRTDFLVVRDVAASGRPPRPTGSAPLKGQASEPPPPLRVPGATYDPTREASVQRARAAADGTPIAALTPAALTPLAGASASVGRGGSRAGSRASSSVTANSLDERLVRLEAALAEEREGRRSVQAQLTRLTELMQAHIARHAPAADKP